VTGVRLRSALVVALLGTSALGAGTLGRLDPVAEIGLLHDRLTIRGPAEGKREAPQRGIMEADPSAEMESRVVVDVGDERMVIIVTELVALAPEDLTASVRQQAGAPAKVAPVAARDAAVRVVEVVPPESPASGDAIPVLTAFVAQPDRTVQALHFYANKAAARDLEGCRSLAHKMAATLAPGKRRLEVAGGERVLGPVAVTLPAGYHLATQRGPDFVVYHLQKLLPLGAAPSAVGVYVGGHPALHHERTGAENVQSGPGDLLGQTVTWYQWSPGGDGGRAAVEREAIVPLPDGSQMHVWLVAGDAGALAELRALVPSLRPAK